MSEIQTAIAKLGPGPLREQSLREHIFPLFSRVLKRREIYLANHSLGRPLDQTANDIAEAMNAWYEFMDDAWEPWLQEMASFRARVAELTGASRTDCVVPKSSVGQGLRAVANALKPQRPAVIATRGEFDSVDFILKVYQERGRADVRWIEQREQQTGTFKQPPVIDVDDVLAAIDRSRADLLVISQVYYSTGQVLGRLEEMTRAAHARGTLVFLDCYHACGVVPVSFERIGADFAAGGSYKYTRGGPGACWLAVHPRHLDCPQSDQLDFTLDTGWFAKADTFKFERPDKPRFAPGGDAWLESTMAVLPFYQARAGLQFTLGMGVERLRSYSLEQQEFLRDELSRRGVPVVNDGERGAFLLVPSPDANTIISRLKAASVNADTRLGFVRICPDVLTTREEMTRAAELIARAMA